LTKIHPTMSQPRQRMPVVVLAAKWWHNKWIDMQVAFKIQQCFITKRFKPMTDHDMKQRRTGSSVCHCYHFTRGQFFEKHAMMLTVDERMIRNKIVFSEACYEWRRLKMRIRVKESISTLSRKQ
jgi:hypothetical protein